MFKRNYFLRLCAVFTAAVILCGSFAGCKKARTHTEVVTSEYEVEIDVAPESSAASESSDTSETSSGNGQSNNSNNNYTSSPSGTSGNSFLSGGGMGSTGKRVSIEYLDAFLLSAHPTFYWSELDNGRKVNLYLYTADGSKEVWVKKGLTGSSYKCEATLEHGKQYLLKATYTESDGTEKVINTVGESGKVMTCIANKVNNGKNYSFDGSISFEVLNNYLSSAVSYGGFTGTQYEAFSGTAADEGIRFLTNVGAKYVQRAGGEWHPSNTLEVNFEYVKSKLAAAHAIDPDIIFEACIFECVTESVNNIAIPAFVFEAFGLEPETRNFNVKDMIFESGYGWNYWADPAHLPDITSQEFQMFVYYRACRYIDMGFEALHLGQVKLTGRLETETGNATWTKVIKMIRDYAKKNARRHYVLINAHNNEFTDPNGVMLADMIVAPIRPKPVGEKHEPSETNPQKCILEAEYWGAPYGAGISGTSPSGWYAENYPYLVEFDNYGTVMGDTSDPNSYVWGRDEIAWYSVQPQWYRQEFLTYVIDRLKEFNDNGHVSFPAQRSSLIKANNKSNLCPDGVGDENWMKVLLNK